MNKKFETASILYKKNCYSHNLNKKFETISILYKKICYSRNLIQS